MPGVTTRDEMRAALFKMFQGAVHIEQPLEICVFFKKSGQTLLVLVRSRGVDVLETPLTRTQVTNGEGLLRPSICREGGRLAQYNCTENKLPVYDQVVEMASHFVQGTPIEERFFGYFGIGRSEWVEKYGERKKRMTQRSDLRDIYDAACGTPGKPAYLGDGV